MPHLLPQPSARTPRGPRSRALTLVEIVIALAITAMACGVMAALIGATAQGTSTQNDGRRALVRTQSIKATLQDELYNARAILATSSTYVVYWTGDQYLSPTTPNNAVNLSELRLLELDASGTLRLYYVPLPATTASNAILTAFRTYDTTCAASSSWYATFNSMKSTYPAYITSITLAKNVSAFSASLDNASPTSAKIIYLSMTISDGTVSRPVAFAAALAHPQAPY